MSGNKSMVGDPINFCGLVYGPMNENGLIFLFGKVVEDLLQGKIIEYTRMGPEATFKKAKRQKNKTDEQGSLLNAD